MFKLKRSGFTLIELVSVVAIVAVLALIAVPRLLNFVEAQRVATFESNHDVLRSALTMYIGLHNGEVPSDLASLGPYVSNVELDGPNRGKVSEYFNGSGTEASPADNAKPTGAYYKWDGTTLTSKLIGLEKEYNGRAGIYASGVYTMTYSPVS